MRLLPGLSRGLPLAQHAGADEGEEARGLVPPDPGDVALGVDGGGQQR